MQYTQINTIIVTPQIVMASSLALTLDILTTANMVAEGLGVPQSFRINRIRPSEPMKARRPADLVVLPGFGFATRQDVEDAFSTKEFHDVVQTLIALRAENTVFATSCTGVFAFGEAGMINGKSVTTTWWLAPLLQERFSRTRLAAGELVIEDGDIITAGAALAHVDLMHTLVERFAGVAVADQCRRYLVADERRSQLPYTSTGALVAADQNLRKAEGVHSPECSRTDRHC